jgi:hypothetical protein
VIDENLGQRPVYVIRPPNEIRQLERLYRLEPTAANSLYQVLPFGSAGR